MNWKPTWVLLAGAAVVFAFIVLVEVPARRQRELQASRLILPGLSPGLVTNIEIHPWGQAVIQAVRQGAGGGSWRLARPVSYPANDRDIAVLLDVLAKLEWVDRITEKELKDRPKAQEEFGFTRPRFTMLLQGSGADRGLEIGDYGVFNDRVFLQVVGNNAIFQADAGLLSWLPPDKNAWRDPSLLSLTNLSFQTLRVRAGGKEFDLERDAAHHLWIMRKPLISARADTQKINGLLELLQTTFVTAFVTDDPQADLDPYGLQSSETTPELALSFLNGGNTVAGLQMGRGPTNHPDLVYARRDDSSNVVLVSRLPLRPWEAPYTNFLDQHFISLSPSLVESITVRGDDEFVARKQTNGEWLVTAGKSFSADAVLMGYWLAGLTNTPTEIAKAVVTDFSDYGLSHPCLQYNLRFSPEAGVRDDIHIEFGTNQAGKVFERRLDEDFVNTVNNDDFGRLPRVSWQLRDRQVWNFESSNVVSVTIHQLGGTLKYLRDPDGNWTYAPGFNSQVPINSPATEECVLRIGHLRAIYWDGSGDEHLERFGFEKTSHEVEFEVKEGVNKETYSIQFGYRSPFLHPYATVVRDGERLVFEFPADIYESLVEPNLTLFTARNHHF